MLTRELAIANPKQIISAFQYDNYITKCGIDYCVSSGLSHTVADREREVSLRPKPENRRGVEDYYSAAARIDGAV